MKSSKYNLLKSINRYDETFKDEFVFLLKNIKTLELHKPYPHPHIFGFLDLLTDSNTSDNFLEILYYIDYIQVDSVSFKIIESVDIDLNDVLIMVNENLNIKQFCRLNKLKKLIKN